MSAKKGQIESLDLPPSDEEGLVPEKRRRRPKKRERADNVQLTATAHWTLDFRLSNIARTQRVLKPDGVTFRRMTKTELMLKLLDQGCCSFKIDRSLKTTIAEIEGENMSAA